MRNFRVRRRSLRLLLMTTALLAVAGGVAYATIPSANGTIYGCYRTAASGDNQGQLRIVDSSATCRSNETAITFNEKGSPGAQGAVGPAGPAEIDSAAAPLMVIEYEDYLLSQSFPSPGTAFPNRRLSPSLMRCLAS